MDKELFEVLIKNNVKDRMDIALVNNRVAELANASAKGIKALCNANRFLCIGLISSCVAVYLLNERLEKQTIRVAALEKRIGWLEEPKESVKEE